MGDIADYYLDLMIEGCIGYPKSYNMIYEEPTFEEKRAYAIEQMKITIGHSFPNLEEPMLEKEIERKSIEHAKKCGWITYKFTSPSRRSVPDRIFISPKGEVFFIEFKQQGKKPTPGQDREIERLCQQGCNVFVFDDVEHTKTLCALFGR